jgi:uncharacterized protein involved in exopolysaccharide biosynthesis
MSISSISWYGIRGPVAAIRRFLWLLAVPAAALVGLLLGHLEAERQLILDEGVARVLLAEQTSGDRRAPPADPNRTVRNQASIISSTPVREDAAGRYGNGITIDVVRKRMAVETSTASNLITIRVLDPTPEGAAKLADLVVQAFEGIVGGQSTEDTEATIERLATQKAALQAKLQRIKVAQDREGRDHPGLRAELAAVSGTLQQVVTRELQHTGGRNLPSAMGGLREPPEVSQTPAQPRPKRTMALGALLGLAAGPLPLRRGWLSGDGRSLLVAINV